MLQITLKQDIEIRVGNRIVAKPGTLSRAVGVFVALTSPEKYGREFGYRVTEQMASTFADRMSRAILGHSVAPQIQSGGLWEKTKGVIGAQAGPLTALGNLGARANIEVRKWAMSQHLVRLTGESKDPSGYGKHAHGRIGQAIEHGYTITVTKPMAKFFKAMVFMRGWPKEWLAMARVGRTINVPPKKFWGVTLGTMIQEGVFEKIMREALDARIETIAREMLARAA